ncbi:MAG: hypothetical protein HYT20_01040 [Candidatus Nealsonbacteria bacterium]|nr:hypothetical protein [Candidatus Nealsonbacteria bacterium]
MVNKKIILAIIILSIAGAAAGGYFYWNKKNTETNALDKINEAANKIKDSATQGVLPSLQTNPLENKPDINPVDKINPYQNIKTNPFE